MRRKILLASGTIQCVILTRFFSIQRQKSPVCINRVSIALISVVFIWHAHPWLFASQFDAISFSTTSYVFVQSLTFEAIHFFFTCRQKDIQFVSRERLFACKTSNIWHNSIHHLMSMSRIHWLYMHLDMKLKKNRNFFFVW